MSTVSVRNKPQALPVVLSTQNQTKQINLIDYLTLDKI